MGIAFVLPQVNNIIQKNEIQVPQALSSYEEIYKGKKENLIKLIDKKSLKVLINKGIVDQTKLKGIYISSAGKKSRGKKYYAMDELAFIAWEALGYNNDDKEYQAWKKENKGKGFKRKKKDWTKNYDDWS